MSDTLVWIDESGMISEAAYDCVRQIYQTDALNLPAIRLAVGLGGLTRLLTREQVVEIYGPEAFIDVTLDEPRRPIWSEIDRNLPLAVQPPHLRNRHERRRWIAKHR